MIEIKTNARGWGAMNFIGIHHTGGAAADYFASSQHLTAEQIDMVHQSRWPTFRSTLGHFGGYNFYIDQNGLITQFRAIGEETAAQVGHNLDAISICLAGNFTKKKDNPFQAVDMPLPAQIASLSWLVKKCLENGMHLRDVVPHRVLQPDHTECYGNYLNDNWGHQFMREYLLERLSFLRMLLERLLSMLPKRAGKLAGSPRLEDRACVGSVDLSKVEKPKKL